MSSHLGSKVSSLVDGQLSAAATERALAHVACCPDCARALHQARATHRVLRRELADVAPDPDFTRRLLSLSCGTPGAAQPPSAAPLPSPLVADPELLPPRWQALCGDLTQTRSRRRRRTVAASLALAGVAASGLFALGARPVVTPTRHPADALVALAGAAQGAVRDTDGISTVATPVQTDDVDYDHEVLEWMQAEGWPRPDALPDGLRVTAVRFSGSDAMVLEVDLESPIGTVVVREQKGQLAPAQVEGAEHVLVSGAPVYVLAAQPLHLVWQSSDTVIDLVSQASLEDVLQLVSTFSVDEFDTGFQARVGRGWATLTGVLS